MAKVIPMRLCVGCNSMNTKDKMMKIVKTKDNEIILDLNMKHSGRGAYMCKDAQCIEKAKKNKGLERSFKMPVDVRIYDMITKEFSFGTK